MGMPKIAVPMACTLLVIGVFVGVVAARAKMFDPPSMEMVTSICQPTDYKESCASSLQSVAGNASASPNDYIHAVLAAALKEVNETVAATGKMVLDKDKDDYDYMALEDCKHMLNHAADMLQASISTVRNADPNTLQERQHELLSWMTAVYALQTTCTDNIRGAELKSSMQNGMLNSTHNAVNVVAELSETLRLFNVNVSSVEQQTASQQALEEGFPYWLGTVERKLLVKKGGVLPNVVVAKDGSGQYKSINEALRAYPPKLKGRFVIYVKAGVYQEKVVVDRTKPNIYMYGDGIGKTIVTGKLNAMSGIGTMNTATFANEAVGFIARWMTFRNEAGPEGHQAVAFRSSGDKTALFACSFEGYQDTLYYQINRQFYKNCRIYGTIDFIFGKGDCVIQDSEIIVRRPMKDQINTITADGREIPRGSNGLVIHHSVITHDASLRDQRFNIPTFLGRPWTPQALTVVMQTAIGDLIRPEGYEKWKGTPSHKTCEMLEFGNTGPGANTARRNKEFPRFKVLSRAEATRFTVARFLQGARWLPHMGVPVQLGLY